MSNEIIHDKVKIKQCVLYYWRTLGKMNRQLNEANNNISTHNIKDMVSQYRSFIKHDKCRPNEINDNHLHTIDLTFEMVSDAIKGSKNNKAPGIDGITNELLKNGGSCLTNSMYELFKKIVKTNEIPKEWNVGVIIPI